MNSSFRKYWILTAVAVFLFASASFAQSTTSVVFTSSAPGNGTTFGGYYMDPYTATVGGVANTTMICDDWSDNTYLGESWTAYQINASTVGNSSLGTPMFGNNQNLYNELAWLGSQMLANYSLAPTTAQQQTETEISFAIWALTWGANGTTAETPAPLPYLCSNLGGSFSGGNNSDTGTCSGLTPGSVAANEWAQALSYLSTAEGSESNYSAAGWEILTPKSGTSNPSGDGTPQEFLVYTPEASTIVMLGADLLGLLALAFFFRRRIVQPVS